MEIHWQVLGGRDVGRGRRSQARVQLSRGHSQAHGELCNGNGLGVLVYWGKTAETLYPHVDLLFNIGNSRRGMYLDEANSFDSDQFLQRDSAGVISGHTPSSGENEVTGEGETGGRSPTERARDVISRRLS